MKNIKRLAILVCYDPEGIIDDYIPYLLDDLSDNLARLIVVFNGNLTEEGRRKLLAYTGEIIERENKGFDAEAWKHALVDYLGWNALSEYDELLLLNDTFYGPFVPFGTIFEKMENSAADFWGLTSHGKFEGNPYGCVYGYIPEHIQSYFVLIRKRMFNSTAFHNYWEDLPDIETFEDAVGKNEIVFTKCFSDLGYSWEVAFTNGEKDKALAYNPIITNTIELLESGFPVVKRKMFVLPQKEVYLITQNEVAKRALSWIREHTDYDLSLIFHNLLRVYNVADIYGASDFNFIIDNHHVENNLISNKKAAVWIHLFYMEDFSKYNAYLENIPETIDIFITTDTDEKVSGIRKELQNLQGNKITVIKKENRGRDISSLLIEGKKYFSKYDYVCFCHDKMSKVACYPFAKSFENLLWENLLSSQEYIKNIINTFDANPCLGVLAVPQIFDFGMAVIGWWGVNYENTLKLLNQLGIKVPIDKEKECLSVGTALWFRPEALKPLFDHPWNYTDFPEEPMPADGTISHAIERSFPFVAQSQGFYTGICMTKEYASIMMNDYKYVVTHSRDIVEINPDRNMVENEDYILIANGLDTNFLGNFFGIKNSLKVFFASVKNYLLKQMKHYIR